MQPQVLAWFDHLVTEELGRTCALPNPSFIENPGFKPDPSVSYTSGYVVPIFSSIAYQAENKTDPPWIEKYKIRRSYNTGISRRRRNLPAE
jgi:hypothetical protein